MDVGYSAVLILVGCAPRAITKKTSYWNRGNVEL